MVMAVSCRHFLMERTCKSDGMGNVLRVNSNQVLHTFIEQDQSSIIMLFCPQKTPS